MTRFDYSTELLTESEMMDRALKGLRAGQIAMGGPLPFRETESNAAFQEFLAAREARRKRSLQRCHHFSLYERPRHEPQKNTGGFVPQASAGIENDPNLTDGARRCARKIMELAYRSNRSGRTLDVTVTYLAKTLGKCRRTVQRYLRLLQREGYIRVEVVAAGGRGCASGWWSSCWRRSFRAITGKNGLKPAENRMRQKSHKSLFYAFNISKGRDARADPCRAMGYPMHGRRISSGIRNVS